MDTTHTGTTVRTPYASLSTPAAIWLIARRQMMEAIWTRSTLVMFGVSLVINTFIVWSTLQPTVRSNASPNHFVVGNTLAFLLLLVALLNAQPAVGIAAGVFAGDKERGCLLPLLATPASNTALLAGKILGAAIPALLYTIIGIILYLLEIILFFGTATLAFMPLGLSLVILVFIPALLIFAATIASVVSSRVATFQSAQTYRCSVRPLDLRARRPACLSTGWTTHSPRRSHLATRRGYGEAVGRGMPSLTISID